jgi:uncharacterized repeat protein (TIGR01451 family)
MTLALDQSGNVWRWGTTWLPTGCIDRWSCTSFYPQQIASLSSVVDIALQPDSSRDYQMGLALKADGTVWQWGYAYSQTPVQIPFDRVIAVHAETYYGYAIRSDGSLWQWDYAQSFSPVKLLSSGALSFVDGNTFYGSGLVRLANGHLLNLQAATGLGITSAMSPQFAAIFGTGYSGRLNVANTTVGDDSDLNVAISSDTQSISIGQYFNYVVAVSNLGTGAANNSVVSVALPTAVRINSVPSGCSAAGQIVTCNLGNMAASYATSLSINVQALNAASTTATAYASSDSYDYSSAGNVAGVDIAIQAPISSVDNDVPTLPEWGEILLGCLLLASLLKMDRSKYRN